MPLYEYECLTCKDRKELFCSMADRNQVLRCTACGPYTMQLAVSVPNPAVVRFGTHAQKLFKR